MHKNFKTRTSKLSKAALATLSTRTIKALIESDLAEIKPSKQYITLFDVNNRYQLLMKPVSHKEISNAVKNTFEQRQLLFVKSHKYVSGLLNSPDEATRLAAEQVYGAINTFGANFSREKITTQTSNFRLIVDLLLKPELNAALLKLQLDSRVDELDNLQSDYESFYTERGNEQLSYSFPASLRKELVSALVGMYEYCCWMASLKELPEWNLLVATIEKRLDEVYTYRTTTTETPASDENNTKQLKTA
jgi:hypothetical protein